VNNDNRIPVTVYLSRDAFFRLQLLQRQVEAEIGVAPPLSPMLAQACADYVAKHLTDEPKQS
jgi:hypothetical protein